MHPIAKDNKKTGSKSLTCAINGTLRVRLVITVFIATANKQTNKLATHIIIIPYGIEAINRIKPKGFFIISNFKTTSGRFAALSKLRFTKLIGCHINEKHKSHKRGIQPFQRSGSKNVLMVQILQQVQSLVGNDKSAKFY